MLNIFEVAVVGHVLRRMCPVPGVVSTVIGVEEVVTHVAEVLDGLLGLFHVTAELGDLADSCGNNALAPACAVGNCGVTQGYGEVFAGVSLDALNDFNGEAISVFERAAVLVGTMVPILHGELVKQVAFVNGVDLNTVNTGVTEELCGLTESFDHLVDLLNGHGTGGELLCPTVRSLGSGCAGVLNIDYGACKLVQEVVLCENYHPGGNCHGTAKAAGQLDEELCAGLMELDHVLLELLEHSLVLVQPMTAGHTHGVTDTLHAGEDKANALLGSLEQEVSSFLIEVAGLEPAKQGSAAHGALDNAVLDLYIADLERGK